MTANDKKPDPKTPGDKDKKLSQDQQLDEGLSEVGPASDVPSEVQPKKHNIDKG